MAKRILMVLTSHDLMGLSGKKTGNWFDEVATPYYMFAERGFETVMASPRGGAAPIDPLSYHAAFTTPHTERFDKDPAAQRVLVDPVGAHALGVDGRPDPKPRCVRVALLGARPRAADGRGLWLRSVRRQRPRR